MTAASAPTPLLDLVRTFSAYSAWANDRVLDAAAALGVTELTAPGDGAFGSIRDTLVHTASAQRLWLGRWREEPGVGQLDPAAYPDVPAIRAAWSEIEGATQAFLDRLTEPDLARVVAYVNSRGETWAYPLWQQMIHQVNHATQHRSEVAALLTRYGRSPGWLDFLVFLDERGAAGGQ